ncbi:putative RNA-directed DNA polymerase [Helianthus annuus]|nr:putative RNA-directed DNA polymerase [Helianthus annuus]
MQIYVDDIIFGSINDDLCKEFEKVMKRKFEMSSMGEMKFFLGLQVEQIPEGIFIHQIKYVNDVLEKFNMSESTPTSTPLAQNHGICPDEGGEKVDETYYRSIIGSLMYLTASCPDVMYLTCLCARYQSSPKTVTPDDLETNFTASIVQFDPLHNICCVYDEKLPKMAEFKSILEFMKRLPIQKALTNQHLVFRSHIERF